MFLLDDLLLSPVKGVIWIFREIHDAAQQELAGESEAITVALSELYMKLETGQISEAEFDAQGLFEEGVFEAAKLFDNNYTFDFNGPWAPHNFVDLNFTL